MTMDGAPGWARQLIVPTDPYLSCEDCFEQIDGYIDGLATGPTPLAEPLRVHLAACAVCYEEAESLLTLAGDGVGAERLRHAVDGLPS